MNLHRLTHHKSIHPAYPPTASAALDFARKSPEIEYESVDRLGRLPVRNCLMDKSRSEAESQAAVKGKARPLALNVNLPDFTPPLTSAQP